MPTDLGWSGTEGKEGEEGVNARKTAQAHRGQVTSVVCAAVSQSTLRFARDWRLGS